MDNTTSLGHAPAAKWEFDQNVTQCFDDMLSRSIPQYEVMRSLVHSLAKAYAQRRTWIVDIGCSRGIQLEPSSGSSFNRKDRKEHIGNGLRKR